MSVMGSAGRRPGRSLRYLGQGRGRGPGLADNDPLAGIANLFDLGLVFIVGLLLALVSAYRLQELFDPASELTIVKKGSDGSLEIISKKGRRIEARRMSKETAKGRGERLGTAYRLEDGTVVYVPE